VNANELRPLLVEYRNQVEQAWTPETAHEGYPGSVGLPHGQCGATSAWLKKRLWLDHAVRTHFTTGAIKGRLGVTLADHCWLETYGYELVIDLTVDQMDLTTRVVCATPHALAKADLMYIPEAYDPALGMDLLRRADLLGQRIRCAGSGTVAPS
jgi:hypothetical protein